MGLVDPGSAPILFTTYFQVEVSVAVNDWYGPFYDIIQAALGKTWVVTVAEYYGSLLDFLGIVVVAVIVLSLFFVSHYVFRWRAAMNDYYMAHWPRLRHIEGAAARAGRHDALLADDRDLGPAFSDSIMTLIAFLPVLVLSRASPRCRSSAESYPLVVAAMLWSAFDGVPGARRRRCRGCSSGTAGRGGLPQRTRLRRGRRDPGLTHHHARALRERPAELPDSTSTTCISTSPASPTCRSTTCSAT
ncbi:MAG: SbmA/BacA-like family transporter [Amaricoccus sp.]